MTNTLNAFHKREFLKNKFFDMMKDDANQDFMRLIDIHNKFCLDTYGEDFYIYKGLRDLIKKKKVSAIDIVQILESCDSKEVDLLNKPFWLDIKRAKQVTSKANPINAFDLSHHIITRGLIGDYELQDLFEEPRTKSKLKP